MKRVYLSGPISLGGTANEEQIEQNIQRFEVEAALLRGNGQIPLSPIHNGLPQSAPWADHMRVDIEMMLGADEIRLLPGWHHSRGSMLELYVASQVGIEISFA